MAGAVMAGALAGASRPAEETSRSMRRSGLDSRFRGNDGQPMAGALAGASRPAEEVFPVDETQETILRREAGEGFAIKRTPHFVVAHNVPAALADELTARVERTYTAVYRFCEQNRIDAQRPGHRLEVLFFNDRPGYARYAERILFHSEDTYGVYCEPTNRSAFFNVANDPRMMAMHASFLSAKHNLDAMVEAMNEIRGSRTVVDVEFADGRHIRMPKAQAAKEIESTRQELKNLEKRRLGAVNHINRTVIQHEIAHQVLYNAGVHIRGVWNPKWVVEGLALLFETPPGKDGAGIAGVNHLRLQDFREAVAGDGKASRLTADDCLNAMAAGRIVSLRQLISDPRLLEEGGGPSGSMHYATAWALTHYLHRARGEQLGAYLREVRTRRPGEPITPVQELALFEKHFGPIDEAFLRRWSSYILSLAVRSVPGGT